MVSKMTSRCMGTVQMKWEKSPKAGSESEKRCDLRREQKMERGGNSDLRWKTVPHTSGCNRKRSVIDGQVCRTSRVVDEAENVVVVWIVCLVK